MANSGMGDELDLGRVYRPVCGLALAAGQMDSAYRRSA